MCSSSYKLKMAPSIVYVCLLSGDQLWRSLLCWRCLVEKWCRVIYDGYWTNTWWLERASHWGSFTEWKLWILMYLLQWFLKHPSQSIVIYIFFIPELAIQSNLFHTAITCWNWLGRDGSCWWDNVAWQCWVICLCKKDRWIGKTSNAGGGSLWCHVIMPPAALAASWRHSLPTVTAACALCCLLLARFIVAVLLLSLPWYVKVKARI